MAVADWVRPRERTSPRCCQSATGTVPTGSGLAAVRERCPGVAGLRKPAVIEGLRQVVPPPEVSRRSGNPGFPGQAMMTTRADPLEGRPSSLKAKIVAASSTSAHRTPTDTTVARPDIGRLVVAGPTRHYNEVHRTGGIQTLRAAQTGLAALDILEASIACRRRGQKRTQRRQLTHHQRKLASTYATSTGSTRRRRKHHGRGNSTGRCWRLTRTSSIRRTVALVRGERP